MAITTGSASIRSAATAVGDTAVAGLLAALGGEVITLAVPLAYAFAAVALVQARPGVSPGRLIELAHHALRGQRARRPRNRGAPQAAAPLR